MSWADDVSAVADIFTPILVLVIGFFVTRQQWRNQELIKARLEAYQSIAGPLNDLLCYFTFIGRWKQWSPVEVVALKRALDRDFFIAAPLFHPDATRAYRQFMALTFETFGEWGRDASLRTESERRQHWYPGEWQQEWADRFTRTEVGREDLEAIRAAYDRLLGTLVQDVTHPRASYTTPRVSWNAS